MRPLRKHVVIPDTQVRPGVPTIHLSWIGRYIVDEFCGKDIVVVHLGDHWDMPSLSSYDRGKKAMEGRRYEEDIEAGNAGFDLLNEAFYSRKARKWDIPKLFLDGNHEHRVTRATEDTAQLDGALSLDDMRVEAHGWERHAFLEPVEVDGIIYAHYFYNPMSGRPYGGQARHRLTQLGHSFTQGHQQTFDYALRFVGGRSQHGLIAGACYLHDEDYKGPQGNAHWRGIIVKNEVERGGYDIMPVSLDYLCRRYEGMRLAEFMRVGL